MTMNNAYKKLSSMGSDRRAIRAQKMTVMYGITSFILVLVIGQIRLVTATINAYVGGIDAIVPPAADASLVGMLLNVGLLRYLCLMEQ
jgi:hypothetical protein